MSDQFGSPLKFRARWAELQKDGYVKFQAGTWRLTERGLAVLMAYADRPLAKTQLRKASLADERSRTDAERRQLTYQPLKKGQHDNA